MVLKSQDITTFKAMKSLTNWQEQVQKYEILARKRCSKHHRFWKNMAFKKHSEAIDHTQQTKKRIEICMNTFSINKKNISKWNSHRPLSSQLLHNRVNNRLLCDKCSDIETSDQFLCQCPGYITARAKCYGMYILSHNNIWSVPLHTILDYFNTTRRILVVNYEYAQQAHWRHRCKVFPPIWTKLDENIEIWGTQPSGVVSL